VPVLRAKFIRLRSCETEKSRRLPFSAIVGLRNSIVHMDLKLN
jgi:hypothetical protein